jgi:hypothetical protein
VIIRAAWLANALFAVTAVPAAATGLDAVDTLAIVVALVEFAAGTALCVYAFAVGLARTTRGDDVAVANLFLAQGSVPGEVRRQFVLAGLVSFVIMGATVAWEPFGVLVLMLPFGLVGTWSARHGTFPPRTAAGRSGPR